MIKRHRRIHSCSERTAGSQNKYTVYFWSCYMLQSTFKESLNLLIQQTVPDAQVIAREREEEAAFSFKVKTTDISEHFGFNMILLKSLSIHSVFYQK